MAEEKKEKQGSQQNKDEEKQEDKQEETDKDNDKDKNKKKPKKENGDGESGGLTSPEGILLLLVAAILDAAGLIMLLLAWLGVDDYGVLDVMGFVIIGGWMFMKNGTVSKDIMKKSAKRLAVASIIELIPFIGSACPSWTILVWKELKKQ